MLKLVKFLLHLHYLEALIGKVAGDIAEFQSPNGIQEYEIIVLNIIYDNSSLKITNILPILLIVTESVILQIFS